MARNSRTIIDEYTDRKDLTRLQKWRLRHPEEGEKARRYTAQYFIDNPNHLRDWRKDNPELHKKQVERYSASARLRRYNLTSEQYSELFEKQNKVCAICLQDKNHKYNWNIDHNHQTNKVRGILCSRCNVLLGLCKESIQTLENAIKYLKHHE